MSAASARSAARARRVLAIVLLALCAFAAGGPAITAAATGVASATPAPDAHLTGPPVGLRMAFVAPIEARFLVLELWDHGRLTSLPARIDPTDPQAAIAPMGRRGAAAGQAWVRYRALTADGHVFSGTYPVQIGAGGPATPAPDRLGAAAGAWLTGLGRGLVIAGLVVALGVLVLRWGVAGPAWRDGGVVPPGRPDDGDAFRRRTAVALTQGGQGWWVLWWVALAAWLAGGALAGLGLCWWIGTGSSGIATLVFDTRPGHAVLALVVLALAALLVTAVARRRRDALRPDFALAWGVALGIAAAAGLVVMSWQGHASDGTDVAINIAADALHGIATAAWIGGLVGLLVLLVTPAQELPGADRVRLLAGAVVRFSSLAIACVTVLVITGTYRALAELSSLSQLVSTGYGRALTVKLVIFAVMLGAGGYSRIVLHPRLERTALGLDPDERGASRALRTSLRAELGMAAALLVAVAVLLAMTPPG